MSKRKRIGLITITLEGDSEQRIITGAMRQCEKYDYDLVVFSPLVHPAHNQERYLAGELNIYELINFDLLDGVIVTPVSFNERQDFTLWNSLLNKLKAECKVPVVSFNSQFGDYDYVLSDERSCMAHMASHLIKVHNCSKIDILAGPETSDISRERVEGIFDTMEYYGLEMDKCNLFYGDFWYSSGEKLARRYINKELPLPDAVICCSDHMAIGLSEKLIDGGINVPEDIIVTGFGDTIDAVLSIPPITTYVTDDEVTASLCVNRIRELIEPTAPILPPDAAISDDNICIGGSCGCVENTRKMRFRLRNLLYCSPHGAEERAERFGVDSTTLNESYAMELFTSATTPEECLRHIYNSKFLLMPYQNFYICMNENWLDTDQVIRKGYTENMHLVLHSENPTKQHGYSSHVHVGKRNTVSFKTKDILPCFSEETGHASVYFFVPLHFNDVSLGYFCLRNSLHTENLPDSVFRSYIRVLNNALEMTRAKNRITELSEHDSMTGLLNRRGLSSSLNLMLTKARLGDKLMAIVADMDNLKSTNDLFGHDIGDIGLQAIANVCDSVAAYNEICVRAGGDEFYIIGVGDYDDEKVHTRIAEFKKALEEENNRIKAPVKFEASIGYSILPIENKDAINQALIHADAAMYRDKRQKKERNPL